MMKKVIFCALLGWIGLRVSAQEQAIVHEGEFGFNVGASQYFGDLNPNPRFNTPNIAFGAFFRKQFGGYVALRVAANYTFLGYSDRYNSYNEFMYRRNLSFNTNIYELGVQGDFNFFKFVPGSAYNRFTPYITFGIGIFYYNPYTYYQGQKVYLRPLGTEGQGSAAYPNRKEYSTWPSVFRIGVGIKYNLNRRMNIGLEFVYRFTTTDYIDDVSTTYAPMLSRIIYQMVSPRSGTHWKTGRTRRVSLSASRGGSGDIPIRRTAGSPGSSWFPGTLWVTDAPAQTS